MFVLFFFHKELLLYLSSSFLWQIKSSFIDEGFWVGAEIIVQQQLLQLYFDEAILEIGRDLAQIEFTNGSQICHKTGLICWHIYILRCLWKQFQRLRLFTNVTTRKGENENFSKLVKCAHRRSNLSNWETKLTENDAILHFSCELVQFLKMEEIFSLHC